LEFSEQQIQRYARHILLDQIGGTGQASLINSKVLVVGAGGLGSPVILYLAAAGVGTIGVIDDDVVDLSNLQRQILHTTHSIGTAKVLSAEKTIHEINPEVKIIPIQERIGPDNAMDLIAQYDLVADGCDNFETRFLVTMPVIFPARPWYLPPFFVLMGKFTRSSPTRKMQKGTIFPVIAACSPRPRHPVKYRLVPRPEFWVRYVARSAPYKLPK
jgi:molybdopterin/thiamine biosynthesis adenylyltransferase